MKEPTKPGLDFAHDLVHCCASAALATHSVAMPGFPFATSVAIAPMADHRPWMLLSRLAEHRVNLEANPRASLNLIAPEATLPMSAARITLVGTVHRVDPTPRERARFLAYLPDAEPLLSLGDFAFFALDWTTGRAIGGFGRMGWVAREPASIAALSAEDEAVLRARVMAAARTDIQWLGADAQGFDVLTPTGRQRVRLSSDAPPSVLSAALRTAGLDRQAPAI